MISPDYRTSRLHVELVFPPGVPSPGLIAPPFSQPQKTPMKSIAPRLVFASLSAAWYLVSSTLPAAETTAGPIAPSAPLRLPENGKNLPPFAAPAWALPDATGKTWRLEDFHGSPTVLFFFKGQGCLHCQQQVGLFAARAQEFADRGIKLVGITTDTVDELKVATGEDAVPFPVLSDPGLEVFRRYRCFSTEVQHGTFVLDAGGAVHWQTIGPSPFTGVGLLFMEAGKLAPRGPSRFVAAAMAATPGTGAAPARAASPQIEVQVRDTSTGDDDYIAWAPSAVRIRQIPATSGAADLAVVLTNDPAQPVPAGRTLPLDGDVVFAPTLNPSVTPTAATLALTLPKSGEWVSFAIAGKFPQASTADKDAIIEVHQQTATGTILQRHALMVRVRKDHTTLTAQERTRFLEALDYLNRTAIGPDGESRYMYFVRLHQAAAVGLYFGERPDVSYYWPDLAHKGPGFIAWHRAFLLEFEREIQKTFPDVALPYWVMPKPSLLFTEDFMGANDIIASSQPTPMAARFAPTNPLYGWTVDIDGAHNEQVQRFAVTRTPGTAGFPRFATDADLFKLTRYSLYPDRGGFVDALESNPHNIGHNWTGPWMQNCMTSPRDPIFWVFHTGFDRQWAHWQYLNNRFDATGGGDSYAPLGDFAHPLAPLPGPGDCDDVTTANNCIPITHRVGDQLWPWSGQLGKAATKKGSLPQTSFGQPFIHPFPTAPAPGLWPQQPARPKTGDMVDYLGLGSGRLPMGFGYDDTPYGKAPAPALIAAQSAVTSTAQQEKVSNRKLTTSQRLAAVQSLESAAAPAGQSLLAVARAKDEDDVLRAGALRAAQQVDAPTWIDEALTILKDRDASHATLAVETVNLLSEAMMLTTRGTARRNEIATALDSALSDPREPVRLAALWAVVGMDHSATAVAVLTQALNSPAGAPFTPHDAIRGLALARQATANAPLIRPYLAHADPALRALAVSALAGDADSRPAILQLLADRAQPLEVRLAALRAIGREDSATVAAVLDLATNADEPTALRVEAVATLGLATRSTKTPLPAATLQAVSQRLSRLSAADANRLGPVVPRAVFDANRRLNSSPEK
jgi:peroxiredoxin